MYQGPVIDAHFHYYNIEGFHEVALEAGHENTAECWREICEHCNIVFSVAMGNTYGATVRYGGVSPRLIDLKQDFDEESFNQDTQVGYCLGVDSESITQKNSEKTALEFEYYLKKKNSNCVGIKLYPGYNAVYVNDKRHWPLFELARAYDVPVVIHTGDTSTPTGRLKYSHPLTVDDAAVDFPETSFVLAHCGCPWFMDAAEVAGKNKNVSIDLSGLIGGNPKPMVLYEDNAGLFRLLRTALYYMGDFERVMYGSDWPLPNVPMYIRALGHVVPEQHHEKFFFRNALRIFNRIPPILKDLGIKF